MKVIFEKSSVMIKDKENLEGARILMDDFAGRTGLTCREGNIEDRYLWTDAFAVQAFFGLAHIYKNDFYKNLALKLIDEVHKTLGRYHRDDIRKGWISGLPEDEGKKHPTAGGLRIGKTMPERKINERFDEDLEWERDGQYFHYLTRWLNALLQAGVETREYRFTLWATELIQAGGKFVTESGGRLKMNWKMSIDLSRPLISSMGAHDPLEGLISTKTIQELVPEKTQQLIPLAQNFEKLCSGRSWSTDDPLGIGGLLLNYIRAVELANTNSHLPDEIRPENLFSDCLYGLQDYLRIHNREGSAYGRLAFRECGLSLGLRALSALKEPSEGFKINSDELNSFAPLADDIENFWMNPKNQKATIWTEHLNINTVTLSSSIIAKHYPFAFCLV